jgi:hypothetical protein
MTDKQWITIDPSLFREPVQQKIGSATVTSSTSPYAVPSALATYDDRTSGQYVLEVKYIGPEEPVETVMHNDVRVLRGKNSGRLMKVFVNHTSQEPITVDSFVESVQNSIAKVVSEFGPKDNYKIVSAVVDGNKNRFAFFFPHQEWKYK